MLFFYIVTVLMYFPLVILNLCIFHNLILDSDPFEIFILHFSSFAMFHPTSLFHMKLMILHKILVRSNLMDLLTMLYYLSRGWVALHLPCCMVGVRVPLAVSMLTPNEVPAHEPYSWNNRFGCTAWACTNASNSSRKSSSTNTGLSSERGGITSHISFTADIAYPDLPQCFISL